jgi:hypothetical protein
VLPLLGFTGAANGLPMTTPATPNDYVTPFPMAIYRRADSTPDMAGTQMMLLSSPQLMQRQSSLSGDGVHADFLLSVPITARYGAVQSHIFAGENVQPHLTFQHGEHIREIVLRLSDESGVPVDIGPNHQLDVIMRLWLVDE